MKTLKLSVQQRLIFPAMLPKQGGRMKMIITDDLKNRIELSSSEIEQFELKDMPDGGITGNPQKFMDKEFSLTDSEIRILKEMAFDLDRSEAVTRPMLPILDKIDAL